MLAKLCEFDIQADIDKCEFHVIKTKYLGLIISKDGIKMDPAKIKAIKNWSIPKHMKDICAFVGFCNFYQCFIWNFSKIASPFNSLIKKDAVFLWSAEYEKAF